MSKFEHTSVAGVNLEVNKKLGYYLVNNEIYYNKFQAIVDASKTNSEVNWYFNEKIFMKYPWHVEPETSLQELYRMRAQQLRDTYDYIRLEASGGSDSTTVAYSFLLNGIHLDEIVFRYPKQGEKGLSNNSFSVNSENTLSEWDFAAKPLLNWVSENFPKVKITIHDYSIELLEEQDSLDESWVFKSKHFLQPSYIAKHTNTGLIDHRRTADTGLKIAVVYGIDKPKICLKDNKFFLYFVDYFVNHNNADAGDYDITNECFYWTPDMPELIAKQAHIVKSWFSMPQNYSFQSVIRYPNDTFAYRNMYERLVKTIIYPDYDPNTFQTIKPTNNIYNEMDHWIHTNFNNTKFYRAWEAGIDYLLEKIDNKFLNPNSVPHQNNIKQRRDVISFSSLFYCLGDSSIPETLLPRVSNSLSTTSNKKIHKHMIDGKLVIY